MADLLFDKLTYIDKLKEAGVSETVARGHADALDSALRDGVATHADMVLVRTEIALAVRDMTIRMGVIAVALFAALASIRFFP